MKQPRVFLGGTCNESTWRDELMPLLTAANIDFFNPVVSDWTPEAQARERDERVNCDFVLYVITPEMTGVYSIAEVVDDSNKRPLTTIFLVIEELSQGPLFTTGQLRSLRETARLVHRNGASVAITLDDIPQLINKLVEQFSH